MPRSNRQRGRRAAETDDDVDLSRAVLGARTTQSKRDGLWNVQPISAAGATKTYTCPGCGLELSPGVAHLVSWRADGILGDADDLAARRHWHTNCWRIRA